MNRQGNGAARIGAQVVLIPALETAALQDENQQFLFLKSLTEPLATAADHHVILALESDLPARTAVTLVEQAKHPALGIYYDTGNATALGYDIVNELFIVAPHLRGIHIKDRTRGGPNVPLGQGAVDFAGFFHALQQVGYDGALILETVVGDDFAASAQANLSFVRERLRQAEAHA